MVKYTGPDAPAAPGTRDADLPFRPSVKRTDEQPKQQQSCPEESQKSPTNESVARRASTHPY